ncbi:hypothetical protein C6A85_12805, partial [Mycobacterium sp. ITM-2017-0098]
MVAALALSLIAVAAVVFLALFERQELRTDARETASSAATTRMRPLDFFGDLGLAGVLACRGPAAAPAYRVASGSCDD